MFYSQQSWQGGGSSIAGLGSRSQSEADGRGLGGSLAPSSSQERPFSVAGFRPLNNNVPTAGALRGAGQVAIGNTASRPFSQAHRPGSAPSKVQLSLAAALGGAPKPAPAHAPFAASQYTQSSVLESPVNTQVPAPAPAWNNRHAPQPHAANRPGDLLTNNWANPHMTLGSQQQQQRPGSTNSAMDQLMMRPGSAPADSSLALVQRQQQAMNATGGGGGAVPAGSQQTLGSVLAGELELKRTNQALEVLQAQVGSLHDSHATLCAELTTIGRHCQQLASLGQQYSAVTAAVQGMEQRLETHMDQIRELHASAAQQQLVVVRELHAATAEQLQLQQQQQQMVVRVLNEVSVQTSPRLMAVQRAAATGPASGDGFPNQRQYNRATAAGQQRQAATNRQQRRTSKRHSIVVRESYVHEYVEQSEEEQEERVEAMQHQTEGQADGELLYGQHQHHQKQRRLSAHATKQHVTTVVTEHTVEMVEEHVQQEQQACGKYQTKTAPAAASSAPAAATKHRQQQQPHAVGDGRRRSLRTSPALLPQGTAERSRQAASALAAEKGVLGQTPERAGSVCGGKGAGASAAAGVGGGWVQRKRGSRSTPGNSTDGSSGQQAGAVYAKAALVQPGCVGSSQPTHAQPQLPSRQQHGTQLSIQPQGKQQPQQTVSGLPPRGNFPAPAAAAVVSQATPILAKAISVPQKRAAASQEDRVGQRVPSAVQGSLAGKPQQQAVPRAAVSAGTLMAAAPSQQPHARMPRLRNTGRSLMPPRVSAHQTLPTQTQPDAKPSPQLAMQTMGPVAHAQTAAKVTKAPPGARKCDTSRHEQANEWPQPSSHVGNMASMEPDASEEGLPEVDDQELARQVAECLNQHRSRRRRI